MKTEVSSIHPLSVTALSLLWGRRSFCWSQSQLSLGVGRVHPERVASSSQGSHWWQRPPCKVLTAHQEQFGVQYLAQGHFCMQLSSAWSWDLNKRPPDHLPTCSPRWATAAHRRYYVETNNCDWSACVLPYSFLVPEEGVDDENNIKVMVASMIFSFSITHFQPRHFRC